MTKKLNKQNIFFTFFSFLFVFLFVFFNIPMESFADEIINDDIVTTSQSSSDVVVEIYNRNGEKIILSNTVDYSGGKAYLLKWADVEKFIVYYSPADDSIAPPVDYVDGKEETAENLLYTLSLSVSYLQGYADDGSFNVSDTVTLENIYTTTQQGENSYKNFITNKFTLNIDEGKNGTDSTGEQFTIKDWGIYRFTIDINGYEMVSDFYVVEPDLIISEQPKIAYNVVHSENSMHDSFNFYLTNADLYAYTDKSALVWYVKGKGKDGTTYALTSEDLNKENFNDCTNSIYESINRTGTTFYFNDNEISGQWEVWCEYKSHGSENSVKSDLTITVETGTNIDFMMVVYILVAIIILAIIIVTIIAVIKSKKEKVW